MSIPGAVRAAIVDDIRAGTMSRAEIAKKHKVSGASVTNIAKEAGVTTAFDRASTKSATAAANADAAALRASTALRFLTKANELLDQMDRPHRVYNIGGKDNVYTDHVMDRPPTTDLRNLMIAAATALDKHLVIVRHEADPGVESARSMLGALAAGLGAAYEQLTQDAG